MLALSDRVGVVILLGGLVLLALLVGFALFQRAQSREAGPDIPDAMKPGPADAALETPLLQKLQGWAVLLTAFFAIWIPINWLLEPSRNLTQERELKTAAIDRGKADVQLFSEDNQGGVGCTRCHGPELRGGLPIVNIVNGQTTYDVSKDLTTVCGGPFMGHPQIKSVDDIVSTIEQGRPNTPMPSWSIKFQGALDDQQINDIVSYIVSIDQKTVPFDENVCTNPDAAKAAASPSASPSGGASATPSGGASPQASASPSAGAAS